MTEASLEREIGRLEATVEALEKRVESMDAKMDELLAFMQSAKGSWRAMVGVASLASLITAGIAKIVGLIAR